MANISFYEMTDEDLTRHANSVLQVLENAILADGLVEEENFLSKRYIVQVVKPGIFTQLFDKIIYGNKPENKKMIYYRVFKVDLTERESSSEKA
jgi:hypothetical protein